MSNEPQYIVEEASATQEQRWAEMLAVLESELQTEVEDLASDLSDDKYYQTANPLALKHFGRVNLALLSVHRANVAISEILKHMATPIIPNYDAPAPAVPSDDRIAAESSSTPGLAIDAGNGEGFEQQQGTHPTS